MVGRAVGWLFRDRATGRITIAQFPNAALGLFLVASLLRRLLDAGGTAGAVLDLVATGALVWWALDEVVRGVNPWRRFLGGAVLAGQLLRLLG
ncbi:MAG TPA: hypothetical protein VFS16_13050 [Acidimicrobiia bacterium]|nr:hypothetical protein [Acidimicrobiia bacterium]